MLVNILNPQIIHICVKRISRHHKLTHLSKTLLPPSMLPLTAGLVLGTFSLKLVRQSLLSSLLSFGLVNALHQNSLILKDITLNLHVHVMVHVLVNLLGLSVLAEQTSEDTHSPHPKDLCGKPCLSGTLPLTYAHSDKHNK